MAWTTPRTWTDGELVTKAIMDPHVRDNFNAVSWRLLARKSADTARSSTTVLADDPHLTWAIGATESWMFKLGLWVTAANGTPDIKVAFTVPASAVFIASGVYLSAGNVLTQNQFNVSGTAVNLAVSATTGEFFEFSGIVESAGTAGNVVCQWAQQVSDAGATTVQANSHFVGSKLA